MEFYDMVLALIPLTYTTTTVGIRALGVDRRPAMVGGGILALAVVMYALFYQPPTAP